MKLWIDIGNTRLKWQLRENSELVDNGVIVHEGNIEKIFARLGSSFKSSERKVDAVGMASVLNKNSVLVCRDACLKSFGVELAIAEVSRELHGVQCAYQDITQLGVDRWLALVAAYHQYNQAVCVVDCGSALTIDMVNKEGRHLGGYILSGLNMSVNALLGQTQSVRFDGDGFVGSLILGVDTASAVKNGALLQAQSSIVVAWKMFDQQCRDAQKASPKLLLTGGDCEVLSQNLAIDFELQEDLVIQGLRLALE